MNSNTVAGGRKQLERHYTQGDQGRFESLIHLPAGRLKEAARVWILLAIGLVISGTAGAATYQVPDAWITAEAKMSLWTSAGIRSNALKIDTSEGTVTLYGNVDSASQRKKANDLTLGIKGVKHVHDLLQIAQSNAKITTVADEKIRTDVNRALKREPGLKRSSISVQSVNNGIVLLTGTAETMSDQLLAFLVADSADGVRHVLSEIKAPAWFLPVESKEAGELAKRSKSSLTTSANDMRLTTEIKLRFVSDNNTPALSISVDTNRSRVSLFGTVASPAQSERAKSVAQQVGGVKSVQNFLQVVPETRQELAKADDTDIKSTIIKSLQGQPEFNRVDVTVAQGAVRLTGAVPSSWDRLRAALISRSTPGARSIEDQLTVE